MSEMQANQYFISGRYSEAFAEYSILPNTKQNDNIIKEKMIISAALSENFKYALELLSRMIHENVETDEKAKIDYSVYPYRETVTKLENEMHQKNTFADEMKMKIAILSFFTDRNKSMKYFQKLKKSCYADIIKPVLTSLKKTNN